MGKKADALQLERQRIDGMLRKILNADGTGLSTTMLAERRMQELHIAKDKLRNQPQESEAGRYALMALDAVDKALEGHIPSWCTGPTRQADWIRRIINDLREAQQSLKLTLEAFDQQARSWEPVGAVLGQQGHESALDAAKRVVAERDEARAHAYAAEQDAKEAEARCAALIAERDEARAALKAAQESLLVYVEDAQKRAKQSEGE